MEMEEEEETHNIDDLLESETKGEVDRFTVVEHRPLQADNDEMLIDIFFHGIVIMMGMWWLY